MPERLRERILATCGALTAEQQQLMIEFIWLRAHGPREPGERAQRRLMELLDSSGVESERITKALQEAVAQLQRAYSEMTSGGDDATKR
ncbi:MAG TPA: hypothetical protein VF339_14370 [Gammaproteobacteria bacterium]